MRLRLNASFATLCLVSMLVMLWPVQQVAAESDTGDVTVEIVPPGALTESATTTLAGTLSVSIVWLPDPAAGRTRLHGVFAVQDHRASADGWTVRLQGDPSATTFLVRVIVGGTGIHIQDVAVGAPLAESPQLVAAPKPAGYSLTVHQMWIDMDGAPGGDQGGMITLLLILPFAP